MPFLDNIVSALNENWISSLTCFPSIRTFGIAETILEFNENNTKKYPGIIDEYADGKMIDVNKDYHITLYHRLDNITNAINTKQSFGEARTLIETANMSLLCFAFRDKVLKPVYWLENLLKDTCQDSLKIQNFQTSNIIIGNSTFDKMNLLSREYSEVMYFPELMVFEMKYRIESTYQKGCFISKNGC